MQNSDNLSYGEGGKMGRPRKNLDVKRILQLYLNENMSVRRVAEVVGVSHDTVVKRLEEQGIQLRRWMLPVKEK